MKNKSSENLSFLSLQESPEYIDEIADFYKITGGNSRLTAEVLDYEYLRNPEQYGDLFFAIENDSKKVVGASGLIA